MDIHHALEERGARRLVVRHDGLSRARHAHSTAAGSGRRACAAYARGGADGVAAVARGGAEVAGRLIVPKAGRAAERRPFLLSLSTVARALPGAAPPVH